MGKVTRRQMERFPRYLNLLILLKNKGEETISSVQISKYMKCSEEQVRKDLQAIAKNEGKPGVGRDIDETIHDLQDFLGYNNITNAIVVGVGRLGEAFLNYAGFTNYGFNVIAGFDVAPDKVNKVINGKNVYSLNDVTQVIRGKNVEMAILTVPGSAAQSAVELLDNAGIKAVLNFAPVHLEVGDNMIIENIDMAATLAMLSHRLSQLNEEND